jgi:hypothetical protein
MIELSDYLTETLSEAERLLAIKARLGRLPMSKKQRGFKEHMDNLIDEWFEREAKTAPPRRVVSRYHVHDDEVCASQQNLEGITFNSSDIGLVASQAADGLCDEDVVTF